MEMRKNLRWLLIQVALHVVTCVVYNWIISIW